MFLSVSRRSLRGDGAVVSACSSACSFWGLCPCASCPSVCGEHVSCVRGNVGGISHGSTQKSSRIARGRRSWWSRCGGGGGNTMSLRLRDQRQWWRVTVTVSCALGGGRGGGRGGSNGPVLSRRLPDLVARGRVAVGCGARGALSPLWHDACGASFSP